MKTFCFLLLTCIPLASFAQVSPELTLEPLTQTSVKILGKTLSSKGVDEGLALACFNDDCSQARFIFRDQKGVVSWIGDKLFVPHAPTPALQDEALKLTLLEFMSHHQPIDRSRRRFLAEFGIVVAAITGAVVLSAGAPLVVPVSFFIGSMTSIHFVTSTSQFTDLYSASATLEIIRFLPEQGGWNWSQNNLEVSAKRFRNVCLQLTQHEEIANENRAEKTAEKIAKKRRKLEEQGVTFY